MTKEHNLEMLDMIGRDTPGDEIESLRAQLAEVTRKYEESVGGFKRDLQEKLDQQRAKNKRLENKLLATQAHAARLVVALRLVVKCCDEPRSRDNSEHDGLDALEAARSALSTPINLDALHEALARDCERLANQVRSNWSNIGAWLDKEAAAHRAKKEGK